MTIKYLDHLERNIFDNKIINLVNHVAGPTMVDTMALLDKKEE